MENNLVSDEGKPAQHGWCHTYQGRYLRLPHTVGLPTTPVYNRVVAVCRQRQVYIGKCENLIPVMHEQLVNCLSSGNRPLFS